MIEEDPETHAATKLMMSYLTETKKSKAQKQATKSVCLLLRNQNLNKMPALLNAIQEAAHITFFSDSLNFAQNISSPRQIALLNFMAGAL